MLAPPSRDRSDALTHLGFDVTGLSRTTNPIKSTFTTVKLRTKFTKGLCSKEAGLLRMFELAHKAESGWRKLNGSALLWDVIMGIESIKRVQQPV